MDTFVTNEEVPFQFDELFFSRTDPHGIIQSGNEVFQRVSGYSWDELVGKPHKIVRHPDMPRAVFWLLWDTIKKGEPIGAYVKNRAKDGRFYWVFAVITPIEGGFLSVRLKPGSELFATVRQEYETLREVELSRDISPAESAQALLARLKELGFSSYASFMAQAINAEITARAEKLSVVLPEDIRRFGDLVSASRQLLQHTDGIFQAYEQNQYVSMNFQVQAAQLGDTGAAISQISKNYDSISAEIKHSLGHFVDSAGTVGQTMDRGLFLSCVARLQRDVLQQFRRETGARSDESECLRLQMEAFQEKASEGLSTIKGSMAKFVSDCADMKRLAAALEVTRIMGKVESARQLVVGDSLTDLISQLESLQQSISEGLRQIEQLNLTIEAETGSLLAISTSMWRKKLAA